ncbi:MAG: MFS transporter [Verrucomicrobia bacterium 61-8]|nr:MAG: MFS transporter [Verrucomicrobia bacterium 61-8]
MASQENGSGVTATLAWSTLLASLGTSIANIALPTLAGAFSAPFSQVQAVVVAYLAVMTISVVIVGRLGDALGLKPVLLTGIGLFTLASLACGAAPSLRMLVGARAIQGLGAAILMTLSMAMMRQTAGEARVGRAMGLLGTASALGTALGPSLGGLIIPMTGWRGIFWMQVPLGALVFAVALMILPAESRKGTRDGAASMTSICQLSVIPNLLVNLLVAAVMMTTLVVGPFYLGLGLGLPGAAVGLVMAVGPVISIFSGVPSGRLVDAQGSGRVLSLGLGLLTVAAFLLAFLPGMIGVAGYILAVAVLTPGYQLFQAANNTAALASAPSDRRGVISGLLNMSRNVGLIAGASGLGMVFAFGVGKEDLLHATPAEIAVGMRTTFLLAGTMMLFAIGISWRASRVVSRLP